MGIADAPVIDVDSVVNERILAAVERVAVGPGQLGEDALVAGGRLADQAGKPVPCRRGRVRVSDRGRPDADEVGAVAQAGEGVLAAAVGRRRRDEAAVGCGVEFDVDVGQGRIADTAILFEAAPA